MQIKRWHLILLISVLLLFIPLVAMQFTDAVQWSLADFMLAAVLLLGTGFLFDMVLRKVKKKGYRLLLCLGLLFILLLIWTELAVGIFGTPFAGD